MVGVRRMPGLAGRKHQAVLPEQCIKAVPPRHEPGSKKHGEHNPQFVTAYTDINGQHPAWDVPYVSDSQCQPLTGSRLDDNGQTDGRPTQLSGCADWPVPLRFGPRFFSDRDVEEFFSTRNHQLTGFCFQLGERQSFLQIYISSSLMRFFNWAFSSL